VGAVCLHPTTPDAASSPPPYSTPTNPRGRADSAGTDPSDALNPTVVTALAERGVSLTGISPKPITAELLAAADLVVTMSRHATGPTLPPGAGRQQHWQLGFPGDDLEAMRAFCEQVDQQARHSWTTSSDPRGKSLLRNSRVAVLAPVQGSLLEVGTLPTGFRPCVSGGWVRE
jgi:protein-tyrosine-phosphatase